MTTNGEKRCNEHDQTDSACVLYVTIGTYTFQIRRLEYLYYRMSSIDMPHIVLMKIRQVKSSRKSPSHSIKCVLLVVVGLDTLWNKSEKG